MKQCKQCSADGAADHGKHGGDCQDRRPASVTNGGVPATTAATATSTTTATMASPLKTQQPTAAGSGAPKSSTREVKSEGKSSSAAARSSKAPQSALHHHHHHPAAHPYGHHPLMLGGAAGPGGKVANKLASAAGVDSLSALHLLPAHLRDMFLAAHLLRGYYQPAGPLISPHLLPQHPPHLSQHGGGPLSGSKSSGAESESPLQGPPQPPASTTADSTDSDVLLTGGDLAPRGPGPYGGHHRYGPAAGPPPAAQLYPRPLQMHCPPTYLPANYYASPYGQPPPPPPPPPHDMYYAHAYPPHYYPKFPPQYYPTRRQYYPGPPGPPGPEHLYEQPPPSSAPVAPPPPPPAGAQLVPAGPQGPQHLDHYPYAYPGYGSPGPGSGGQCYTRNLQHPPPYLDAHYTTNCPCPMQCPKNVNAGSLIGIKASKGPVATTNNNNNNTNKNNHIVQSQTSTAEPLSSSSYPASSSSSASPAPIDLHAPIASPMAETVPQAPAAHAPPQHTYPHHHQPLQRPPPVEHHPPAPPHHTVPYHLHHPRHGGGLPPVVVVTTAPEVTPPAAHQPTKVTSGSGAETSLQHPVMTTAPSNGSGGGGGSDHLHPAQMCYKAEQLIKPETAPTTLMPDPMHYGDPYLHHYHHPLGYYHHPKLADLKDDLHGQLPPAPPGSQYTMARLEPIDLHVSPPRGPAGLGEKAMQPASLVELEADGKLDALHGSLLPPTTVVKREMEDFKLVSLAGDAGATTLKEEAMCKKEDFEERGLAMTPELLPLLDDRPLVIKKDCDDEKDNVGGVATTVTVEGTFLQPTHRIQHHPLHHHPHHHVHLASHHHHSASTNLLHHPARHHHLHPQHYGGSMQLVQQPPAAATLRPEQASTEMADTKLPIAPRDCKSDLAELVLTTESSMASEVPPPPSPATTTSSTSVICISSDTSGYAVGHHPRDISSDSSISFSDSVNPSMDGEPASPGSGAFPASTVKRRALLVPCKKSTTKQSPPNSYKNLIKRTNGDHPDEGGEFREDESLVPVELSDDDDDDDDEEDEDEEDEQDDEEEDVEKVETAEQARQAARMRAKRGRLASKIAICKKIAKMVVPGGRRNCPSSASLSSGSASGNGSRKLLLLTQPHHSRWAFKNPSPPASRRLVKRVHRVFRTSIESLRKLPPRLGGGLVPTARRQRFVRKLRLSKSPARSVSNGASDTQTASSVERASEVTVLPLNTSVTEVDQAQLPVAVNNPFDSSPEPTVDGAKDSITTEPVKSPLSNVDRTIDLVAKGYFSEPEILPTDLQKSAHSRSWLKKVKQQQQQEGRSHSEQSRGSKRDRDRSSDSAGTKKTKKGAAAAATTPSTENCTVVEKKTKSKSKTPKSAGDGLLNETDQLQPDASQRKTKNKSSRKESKKESKKAKKKRKLQDGSGDDRNKEQLVVGEPIAVEGGLDSAYQRATSTPIRTHGVDDTEVDDQHGAGPCDESVAGCPLDQSSVIDDRETDFDDAATMLVEDDVASVDTSVLITRHNNNNNISTITDKNNPADEQLVVLPAHPLQAIIADGKEGSELEPPEGMEPFLDDPMEDPEDVLQLQAGVTHQQQQQLSLPPPPPPAMMQPQMSTDRPMPMQTDYIDDYEYYDEEDELPPKRATSRTIKRKRTRPKPSKKFSTKKRHRRPSAHRYEVEEFIVPRRCSNIPRWSNGWTWEGQPFQGKVFLNSDDAPVLRTCYPAMRHSEGDIIRPRDCVLLRAGNKRSELPYVAKVAYLWENPEDGEMMMSLLWYYRPEHTEQGRQRADGPDEVFASRHKDHNSVACIEDKCYVLTFSEYCRFRRQMKGFEENVEEQPSIVPPPVQRRENPRLPPPVVSPELVMYCQRVYEFRLKRLLKTTS
ncbi:uncharacterized protein LOC128270181 [Anopheles cruzii]|uniref:uncharacterized protein LOC128270181 n=1 Tax=Anopheles cruzii TaxID=68878 RepID=UPI0022EC3317|nr:uncharacterized protein LOC128270181 [Anopheles cruzii]